MRAMAKSLTFVAFASIQIHARRLTGEEQAQVKLASETAGKAEAAAAETAGRAEAAALMEVGAEAKSGWNPKDYRACIGEEMELVCDQDSYIEVRTAVYNTAKVHNGVSCEPFMGGEEADCKVKNSKKIQEMCDGFHTCKIQPTVHKACKDYPFTFMRVNYECKSSVPKKARKRASATLGTETYEEPPTLPDTKEPDTPSKVVVDKITGDETMDDTTPVKIKGHMGPVASKDVNGDGSRDEDSTMKQCYRLDRGTKFWRKDYLGRLTNCGEFEGCFKVRFEKGGKEFWYTNEKQVPDMDLLLKGDIVRSKDNWLVTFNGIGLKRSDYWSWGVCLPKTQGIQYALTKWNSLKALSQGFK